MLEPLLEHLSELPSTEVYQELKAWKETVEVGLRQKQSDSGGSDNDGNEVEDDVLEADMISDLDPADAMDTTKLTDALETADSDDDTDNSSDDDEVPPTQPKKTKQEHEVTVPPESKSIKHGSSVRGGEGGTHGDSSAAATAAPVRQVVIINVPKPKRRGRTWTTTKQLRQTKLTARLAVHTYPSGLTVSLDQLLTWARSTPNLKYVMEMMEKYPVQLEDAYLRARSIECRWEAMRPTDYMLNFVIPAAITSARKEKTKPDELDDDVKGHAHVYMYEPLIDEEYREDMEVVWEGIPKNEDDEESEEKEGLRGFVERWHEVTMPSTKLIIDPIEWVETPQQPGSSSCGVLVVAQAYNYISGDIERQTYNVSKNDVKVMRLRMLRVIMHSKEQMMSDSDAATATEIDKKLQVELK
ncbi:hypothetical protein GQ600_2779 [Phytophthora cactorum]|nr:hypothetical protein GQ600_2779 [Phytophthora cactorum]